MEFISISCHSLPCSSSSSSSSFYSSSSSSSSHRLLLQIASSPSPPSSSSSSPSDLCFKARNSWSRRRSVVTAKARPERRVESFTGNRNLRLTPSRSLHSLQVRAVNQTFTSFDDLLKNSETALLVDFYATWCGPCQFMVPVLNTVGQALKDKLRIIKIDTEKYPNIASRYGVQALPTLMLFQNGQPIDRLEGAMQAPDLIRRIEVVLSASEGNSK